MRTCAPTSGGSKNTTSPSASCANHVMPKVASSPSIPALRAFEPLAARRTGCPGARSVSTSTVEELFRVPTPMRSTSAAGPPARSDVACVTTAT